MSDVALAAMEMTIPCPVCKEPLLFVDGTIYLDVDRQISITCHSEKCDGKRRHIKGDLLKKMLDNFKKVYRGKEQFSDSP